MNGNGAIMDKDLANKHAREIEEIIVQHHQIIETGQLAGHELLAVRSACSKAIADACERHRQELAIPSIMDEGTWEEPSNAKLANEIAEKKK